MFIQDLTLLFFSNQKVYTRERERGSKYTKIKEKLVLMATKGSPEESLIIINTPGFYPYNLSLVSLFWVELSIRVISRKRLVIFKFSFECANYMKVMTE